MTQIGTIGEQLIGRWLQLQNYELLSQNWRCRWGEIDLIAQDRETKAIAFIEVKTRSDHSWDENGLLAINSLKQQKLLQSASLFLSQNPHLAELPCRFDVGLVSYQVCDRTVDSNFTLQKINQLQIDQSVVIDRYRLTIKNYLQAAFD